MSEDRATTDGSQWRCARTYDDLRDETVFSLMTNATDHNLGDAFSEPTLTITLGPSKSQNKMLFHERTLANDVSLSITLGGVTIPKGPVRTEFRVDGSELHTRVVNRVWPDHDIRWRNRSWSDDVQAESPRWFLGKIRYGTELHIRAYGNHGAEIGTAKFDLSLLDQRIRGIESAFDSGDVSARACTSVDRITPPTTKPGNTASPQAIAPVATDTGEG